MAFKIDKSSATGYSDEIFSVALRGRHKDNKFASKKEIEFAKNILANQNAIRSSRFASLTRGIKRGSVSRADEKLYRKQATIRNASPDFSLVHLINQSLGIGRSRAVSQSDVLSAFTANPYRNKVEEAIRQSALARAASSFSGNEDVVDEQLLERRVQLRDRLRSFREATQRSGFGRYVEAERQSNREIDEQSEYNKDADRRHRLAESRASVRRKAERIDLANRYPAFKRFFLDSRNSTKDIHAMAGYLKGMSKIPLAGGFLRADPMAIGASLAIGNMAFAANAVNDILGTSLTASLDITKIANKEAVGGKINKNFVNAATAAGLSIKSGAVHDLWINLRKKYGPATEDVLFEYGSALATADESIRPMLMDKLGIDDTVANIAMKMSGFNIGAKEARKTASAKAMSEMLLTAMKSDESGFAGKYIAYIFDTDFGRYVMSRMLSAAGADDEYERNTPPPSVLMPSAAGGTSVSVNGNIIIENADNAQDVAEGIKNYVDKHTSRLRAATSQDPGAQ